MLDGEPTQQKDWTEQVGRLDAVSSFGIGADGELYVITLEGDIYRLVPVR